MIKTELINLTKNTGATTRFNNITRQPNTIALH